MTWSNDPSKSIVEMKACVMPYVGVSSSFIHCLSWICSTLYTSLIVETVTKYIYIVLYIQLNQTSVKISSEHNQKLSIFCFNGQSIINHGKIIY